MDAGIGQRFSMRPNPACMGMPAGIRRIQPSLTCGAQSRAQADSGSNDSSNARMIFMRL